MECKTCASSAPETARYCSQCGSLLPFGASGSDHSQLPFGFRSPPYFAQRILDAAPLAIVALDPSGRIQYINRFLEELSGRRLAEIAGRDWFDTFLPERDRVRIREIFRTAVTQAPTRGNRNPIVTASGEERDIEWNDELLQDEQGRVAGLIAIGQDVTEQVRAERAARESEERFRKLMEHSTKVIALYDADTRILYQSPSVRDVLGYEPEEMIGRLAFEYCHPDDRPAIRERMPEILSTPGAIGKVELRSRCKDGSYRWLELIATNRLHDPTIRAVVGSYRDISAQKAVEEILRLQEQAIALSLRPILFADGDGCLNSANRAFVRSWGYADTSDIVGRRLTEVCGPPAAVGEILDKLRGDGNWIGELTGTRRDGTPFPIECTAVAIRDDNDRLKSLMISCADITERKRTQETLQLSERRFRKLIENSADAIALYDAAGTILYRVPTATAMLGYRSDELIGQSAFDYCHPDDAPLAKGVLLAVLERPDQPVRLELRCRTKSGSYRWVELVATNQLEEPAVRAIVGNYRDITDRKESEEREAVRLAKLRRLSELSMRMAGEPPSVFTHVVQMIGELFGVKMVCLMVVENEDLAFQAIFANGRATVDHQRCALAGTACGLVASTGKLLIFDRVRERFPDSKIFQEHNIVTYCGFPAVDGKGCVAAVVCLLHDHPREFAEEDQELLRLIGQRVATEVERTRIQTARQRAEAELRNSEERFRTLFESAPIPIVLTDLDGRYSAVNPAFESSTGFSADEVIAKTSVDIGLIAAETLEARAASAALRSHGRVDNLEVLTRTRSGQLRNCLFSSRVVSLGEAPQVLSLAIDITERKQAEAELRTTKERYELVIRGLNEGVWDLNLVTNELTPSERLLEMIGFDRGEISPDLNAWLDLVHPEDRSMVAEQIRRHSARREPYSIRFRHRHKSGDYLWLHGRGQAVWNERGEVIQLAGSVADITSQVEAQQALEASEERFRMLFEAAPFAVTVNGMDGRFTAVNPAFEQLSGYAASEVLGRIPLDLGMGTGSVGVELVVDILERSGRLDYVETTTRTKGGRRRNVLFCCRLVTLGGKRQILSSSIDITDRKRAEEALRTSEQRLAEAQRIAHVGNWHWEIQTDEIAWSDEVYRIFGMTPRSITPHYQTEFLNLAHPEDRSAIIAAVRETLETGRPYVIEHRIRRADGTERIVRENGEVVRDEHGHTIGMKGTVQDITERIAAESQLKLLRDEMAHVARLGMLGELAAGIAHELNQPLAAIANYAFAVESRLARQSEAGRRQAPESNRSIIRRISDQAERGGEIIRRLQAMIRNQPSQRSTVSISRLIDEVLALLAGDLRLAQIDVSVDAPESLPSVMVDPVQIQQVLFNLIRNSIESLRQQSENRRLGIRADLEPESMLRIRVRDSGAGVPADMQPRLFTPFATSKPKGLGLGLPISKRIIEFHGGEICCNAAIDSGFEVCFSLPIADGESCSHA